MSIEGCVPSTSNREPWNKGPLVGQKRPLKPKKDVWAIRVRLEINGCKRELALFNLAIDRSCELAIWSG